MYCILDRLIAICLAMKKGAASKGKAAKGEAAPEPVEPKPAAKGEEPVKLASLYDKPSVKSALDDACSKVRSAWWVRSAPSCDPCMQAVIEAGFDEDVTVSNVKISVGIVVWVHAWGGCRVLHITSRLMHAYRQGRPRAVRSVRSREVPRHLVDRLRLRGLLLRSLGAAASLLVGAEGHTFTRLRAGPVCTSCKNYRVRPLFISQHEVREGLVLYHAAQEGAWL